MSSQNTTDTDIIYIGTAGNSAAFYDEGYKNTVDAPAWLVAQHLNAFEYPLGRGISVREETARKIGAAMRGQQIELSVHAPYFINLAIDDVERVEKNIGYFLETAEVATWMGAERIVFHPGSVTKMSRDEAMQKAKALLPRILVEVDRAGYGSLRWCPETMGKINQLGTLGEVIELSKLDERLIPTIDFGHLHARGLGALNGKKDFIAILDTLERDLGGERARKFHVHFSRIEFTQRGEKKHHTFADIEFGPDFMPLAEVVAERGLRPHIICESNGTQAKDAGAMRQMLLEYGASGIK